ncbi:MAG: membrane dipeptidase [Sphingomonadaceae bacterium]|nr:membrane dipeptidase [Sphingomonadaceae bacterium]
MAGRGLDRRDFLALAGAGLLAVPSIARAQAAPARRDMLIVNALGGLGDPNPPSSEETPDPRAIEAIEVTERVLADARASGMDAVNVTIGHVAGEDEPFEISVREVAAWDAFVRARPDAVLKVTRAADIERARVERKIGLIYGFQNASMLGEAVDRVDLFANLGVRVFQLTYNPANALGGGAMALGNPPLTPFGRAVIERLNAARVMIDLSHSGTRTCLEAARKSTRPISINHTGCRALTDLPRNKTDLELRAVAARGGFIGIYFMPFLNRDREATAADVVAHIEHAVRVCGEDHVGIGTDGGTTGIDDWATYRVSAAVSQAARTAAGIAATGERPDTLPLVPELTGPGQFMLLADRLAARGFSERRIEKIMGLNFLAFAREIWG